MIYIYLERERERERQHEHQQENTMHLYHLSLARAGSITCATSGNFTGSKQGAHSELAVARGDALAVLKPDAHARMITIAHKECFGTIRSIASFRLTKQPKDYIAVGSDSGKLTILEYDAKRACLVAIHCETFGKSGVRRVVPGQYVCADPKGRAIMIAALEKQKFVYVMNRDSSDVLTISSPLEAHKSHTLCMDLIALDCDFDNPVFAAIEADYADADADPSGEDALATQKHLTFYELDLGLNHVVRKWTGPIDNGAHKLIQVPGGAEGPGGCIVCCENFVLYRNGDDSPELRVVIPRRHSLPATRGVLIISATRHKQKSGFFFLLQSEYGDLYKLTLSYDSGTGNVTDMKLKYFDTIAPTISLNLIIIRKTGFLFAANEFSNHVLYQFLALGDDTDDVESVASSITQVDGGYKPLFLKTKPLQNIAPVDIVDSLSPIVDMKVGNICREETLQILTACGAGSRSSLRILRLGLTVTVMAQSPLPGNPTAVWTVKKNVNDIADAYIVVSFANATLVLSIGETVEEVSDSGFLADASSMYIGLMGEDSFVQVHSNGIRYIQSGKPVTDWRPPGRRSVSQVSANSRQVIISLSGGEIVYFELDDLVQLSEKERKEVSGGEVACLAVANIPQDRQRARFLAVGSFDGTVRILSLDPNDLLQVLTVQALVAPPEDLLFIDAGQTLNLAISLSNGVLLRSEVDNITGQLADTRMRFLGPKAAKLFEIKVEEKPALLALSTRAWLGHVDAGSFKLTPISYEALNYAAAFSSDQCVDGGIVAVAGSFLHVLALERIDNPLNQTSIKLRYTPRRVAMSEELGFIFVCESEKGARSVQIRSIEQNTSTALIEQNDELFGIPKSIQKNEWASCVRVISAASANTLFVNELPSKEATTSLCAMSFENEDSTVVVLGTAENLCFSPVKCTSGHLRVFNVTPEGALAERHKTTVEGIPGAMCAFRGMILVGIGNSLALYQMGKQKLLKKSEIAGLPNSVQSINTNGNRIYVADSQESVHFFKYRHADKSMYVFADDMIPRHISCSINLDYDTVAGGDKFGTFFILRLPTEVSDQIEGDPTGGKHVLAEGKLNGAPNKLEIASQFFVGSAITSLQKAILQPGGNELLLYSTISGALGVFVPFSTREDVDFFQHLEMFMRQESPPVCGRDHMAYRSSFVPVKETVDGDLCEGFGSLAPEVQKRIADGIDHTPEQIIKKLEDFRSIAF